MADRNASGVVLLNSNNYPTWKIQCRMSLMKHGAWGFVTGTEEEPEEGDHAGWRKFNDRSDKALASIVLAVEPALLYMLGDPQDPAEVWEKLSDQFEKKSWANKLALRRKLYSLRLKENESVQQHIKSMIEIFESLSVVGYIVHEEDRVVHILASLPDSLQMLVTALEACPEVPKLEVVLERLMHEEKKLKEKSEQRVKHPEDALLVRSRTGGPVCFYCGRQGHIKKFCDEWLKKVGEGQPENKKGPEIANFSHQVEYDSDVECIALISEVSSEEKKWIVDSAASHHLCNSKCNMKDLRRLRHPKRVKVGNGKYVFAKHEGSVKISVKSGNSIRYVKLHNVLFVPKLKFNLVSVSKSAEYGKRVEFVKSGCKIVDIATGETVVTASKVGELYYLDCVKQQGNRNVGKKVSEREMEKALISIKENSFQEEMLKRLKSIEEDKSKMQIRLDEFEKDRKSSGSYSFKEEKSHNQVRVSSEVMREVVQESKFESSYVESKLEDCGDENIVDNVEESDREDDYENSELDSSFVESEAEYSYENCKISCQQEQEDEVVVESNENNEILSLQVVKYTQD